MTDEKNWLELYPRRVRFRISLVDGIATLWVRDKLYALRAPWRTALFSERYRRGVRTIPLGFGWRLTIRADAPPTTSPEPRND